MDALTAALEVDWSSPPAWVTIPGILVGFCLFVFLSNEWHFSSMRSHYGNISRESHPLMRIL